MVCHAPVNKGPLGTLFIESKRHVLDFSDFSSEEAASLGDLTKTIFTALRPLVKAERIYLVSMMEGIPHFHAWIIPRSQEVKEHGVAFLAKDLSCSEEEAAKLSERLRRLWKEIL